MNWLFITVLASFILGTAGVFDKFLIQKRFFNPWAYTFWIGILGILTLGLAPLGFTFLPAKIILIAFAAGAAFILALFFFFRALEKGEASGALPTIGGFTPIFTLFFAALILDSNLGAGDLAGFVFLVAGGAIFFGIEKKDARFSVILFSILSALLFGFSNTLRKFVFNEGQFISGLIWISLGGALFVLISLLFSNIRKNIFASFKTAKVSSKALYLGNRAWSALGTFFIYYAIFLGQPALVEAAQSLKYVVIFFAAWILLKEKFSGKALFGKIAATVIIILGLIWLGGLEYARSIPVDINRPINWGVTFSAKFSRELGLNWQEAYEAILKELKPRKIRLVAYWDEIEKEEGVYNFLEMDRLLQRAKDYKVPAILVLGGRVPRWPECHEPDWVKNQPSETRNQKLLAYMREIVARYRGFSNLYAWQVENEPFLAFGKCPKVKEEFLDKEINLVRSLDPVHPIIITDSGEFGLWLKAVKRGDIFGTTMYRRVYPPSVGWLIGNVEYPTGPSFFRLKEKIIRRLSGDYDKKFVVIELQAEPWGKVEIPRLSYEEQMELFSPEYFFDTIEYAKETGFNEYYLWGAEWWYWLKVKHNNPEFWNSAKDLLNNARNPF